MRRFNQIIFLLSIALLVISFFPQEVEESSIKVPVSQGDTVWNICEKYYDKNEVRYFLEFVDDVRVENGLTGNNILMAGQTLTIRITKRK